MSLLIILVGLLSLCFPRSRGDEPRSDSLTNLALAFSPLTRG